MKLNVMEKIAVAQVSVAQNKLAYSVEEVSGFTSLSKAFLRNEIRAGNLKANKFGRRVLVLTENLRDYLNKGETTDEK